MTNVRKDFLIERYSVISEKRSARPHQFKGDDTKTVKKVTEQKSSSASPILSNTSAPVQPLPSAQAQPLPVCFFCPGNEGLTPPTIDQYPTKGPWQLRVFRNKFPALTPPKGDHEVIVEVKEHDRALHDLRPGEIVQAFKMYEKRRKVLERKYKHVAIFKNVGKEGGASLAHSHTQILASNFIPPLVSQELEASKRHYDKWHRCAWCDEIKKAGKRIAYETKYTIAIAANAPRFNYELWILPKRHIGNFSDMSEDEALDFCRVLKDALTKISLLKEPPTYNYVIHHAQRGAKWFHFHLEIMPRLAIHAGYELGEGAYIVSTLPETAAKFYKSVK